MSDLLDMVTAFSPTLREELGQLWTGTINETFLGWTSGTLVNVGPAGKPDQQESMLLVWRLDGSEDLGQAPVHSEVRKADARANTAARAEDARERMQDALANGDGSQYVLCTDCGANVLKKSYDVHLVHECRLTNETKTKRQPLLRVSKAGGDAVQCFTAVSLHSTGAARRRIIKMRSNAKKTDKDYIEMVYSIKLSHSVARLSHLPDHVSIPMRFK